METYEEHMQRMLAAGGAHECASDCPPLTGTESTAPTPEARTKAGQEMESWLREPEDYEWGRKVTAAILAIEAEAAQPAPLLDTLSNALHAIGGEFCSPFTDAHPAGMHNSQAAAILSLTEQPAPPLDVVRLDDAALMSLASMVRHQMEVRGLIGSVTTSYREARDD